MSGYNNTTILPNTFKIDTTTSFFQKVIYARPYQKCLGNQARLQRDQRGVVFVHCRYYNEGTMLFLFGLTTIHRQVNFIYTANTKIHKRKLKSTYCVSETRNVEAALHMHRIYNPVRKIILMSIRQMLLTIENRQRHAFGCYVEHLLHILITFVIS